MSLNHMFVQILSLKYLIIYLPNMGKSLKYVRKWKAKFILVMHSWYSELLGSNYPTHQITHRLNFVISNNYFSKWNLKTCNHTYLTQRLALLDRWFLTCQTVYEISRIRCRQIHTFVFNFMLAANQTRKIYHGCQIIHWLPPKEKEMCSSKSIILTI